MATIREIPDQNGPRHDDEGRGERLQAVQGHLTPEQQRRPRYGQPFWPVTIAGSSMYILVTAIVLIGLALVHPADSFTTMPDNTAVHPADPLNHEAVNPRPEWYFLFLFQILKVFGGSLELIGTLVIPAIGGLVLIGLPFYDRNWSRRAVKRPIAITLATVSLAGIAYLTYVPISNSIIPTGGADYLTTVAAHPKWSNIEAIFAQNCKGCHVGVSNYQGGLNLSTYEATIKGSAGGGVFPGPVLKPGNAKDSYIYAVVEWDRATMKKYDHGIGGTMPLGMPQIAKTDRQNLYNWIHDGAKNNG